MKTNRPAARNLSTTLRFTGEFDNGNEAAASYWLANWANHAAAVASIHRALRTGWAEFQTPQGEMSIRRLG